MMCKFWSVICRFIKPSLLSVLAALPVIAQAGLPEAQTAWREGRYVQARIELTPLANKGDALAEVLLARIYESGLAVPINYQKARALMEKAAAHGNQAARIELLDRQIAQAIVEKNAKLEAELEKKVQGLRAAQLSEVESKAAQGDVDSQLSLGQNYLYGAKTPDETQQGIALITKAAEAGNPYAQFELGQVFVNYKKFSKLKPDMEKANAWWTKAAQEFRRQAEQGNLNAAGRLARMYQGGYGVHTDPLLAAILWEISFGEKGADWDDIRTEELDNLQRDMSDADKARVDEVAKQWRGGQALPTDMRGAACNPSKFSQEKFDLVTAQAQFSDFQKRLRARVDAFRNSNGMNDVKNEEEAFAVAHRYFGGVIAIGPKGDSLLSILTFPTRGGFSLPPKIMLENVMNKACPVGFGGIFTDEGRAVELWYIDLDPTDNGPMNAFKDPLLPPYGSLKRDTFPAMIFVRGKDGSLEWYGLSKELNRILNYWVNAQIL